jgi:hypothetical protein
MKHESLDSGEQSGFIAIIRCSTPNTASGMEVPEIGRPLKWLNMIQRMQQPQNICIIMRLFGPKKAFQACEGCN